MTTTDSLTRRHEDELQIRGVLARLAHLADYGELDEYMTLFTDDASWDLGGSLVHGADAIRADRVSRREQRTQGPGTNTRHMITTSWVDVDGSDDATAHSYFVFVRDASTAPVLGLTGRYHDSLRRTPDGWKMTHRRIHLSD